MLSFLFLYSCSKDEISPTNTDNANTLASVRGGEKETESVLNDTPDQDLKFLFDLMAEEMDGDDLLRFTKNYGHPHANKGFRKSGEDFYITSIPTIKAGTITGIIKVMVKHNNVDVIYFFPLEEIETAIGKDYLETEDYHLYRGAVQSLILCANGMNTTLDDKYLAWLKSNHDRAGERIDLVCLTIYDDCSYPEFAAINPIAFQLHGNEIWCNYVSTECYISQPYVGGGFGNISPNIDNSSGPTDPNNSGGSSNSPNINEDFYAEKAAFLEKWLEDNDVDNELFDQLYECVYHLYVEGYGLVEPTGIAPGCVEEELATEDAKTIILTNLIEEYDLDFDTETRNHLLSTDNQTLSELVDFLENSEYTYVKIIIVGGYIMGIDEEGVLHINLDKIDIDTSSPQEIFDQIVEVLHCTNLEFCEEGIAYKPIFWQDYFSNIDGNTEMTFGNSLGMPSPINYMGCPVGMTFTMVWTGGTLKMHTGIKYFSSVEINGGTPAQYNRWGTPVGENRSVLEISVPNTCLNEFLGEVEPEC